MLVKHPSKPYNPDIANAFFRSGYVEAWGRGIEKITTQCVEAGLPKPIFNVEGNDFWAIFRRDRFNEQSLRELGLNERQIDALLFYKNKKEITGFEYAERYEIAERTARADLAELVEKQVLTKIGETKSVKYIFIAE